MNAQQWEDWLRKQAEETLEIKGDAVDRFVGKNFEGGDSTLRVRLQFIADSKSFTNAQVQRLEALWRAYDSALTTGEALRFRRRYGRGSL